MKKINFLFILLFPIVLKAQKSNIITAIDSICVFKTQRTMQIFYQKKQLKTFNIGLGSVSEGAKHFQGDGKTPEGHYVISSKNSHSKYKKALRISYPSFKDQLWAKLKGKKAGGNICIHGLPEGYVDEGVKNGMTDWTAGCIAIKNADIDFIFPLVNIGCPIQIIP